MIALPHNCCALLKRCLRFRRQKNLMFRHDTRIGHAVRQLIAFSLCSLATLFASACAAKHPVQWISYEGPSTAYVVDLGALSTGSYTYIQFLLFKPAPPHVYDDGEECFVILRVSRSVSRQATAPQIVEGFALTGRMHYSDSMRLEESHIDVRRRLGGGVLLAGSMRFTWGEGEMKRIATREVATAGLALPSRKDAVCSTYSDPYVRSMPQLADWRDDLQRAGCPLQ